MATKWGICSAGKISNDFANAINIHLLVSDSQHVLQAVAARSLKRAQEFAIRHKVIKVYGSYEELSQDQDVEIVYIGTINPEHYTVCKMMLNAGKAVLCEKPLAMSLKETKELIDLAVAKDVFFMEGVWSRCNPLYKILQEEIASGSIGEVKSITANLGKNFLHVDRILSKELGGGAILDLGVYLLQLAIFVFQSEPEKTYFHGALTETGVDEYCSMTLQWSKNRFASLNVSVGAELQNDAYICGTKGKIKIPAPFWCPTELHTPEKRHEIDLPKLPLPMTFINSELLVHQQNEVRRCLLKGLKMTPLMPHSDTLKLAKLMEDARRSVGVIP